MAVNMTKLRGEWIAQGYTNESFAEKIGVYKSTISRWMGGGAEKISIGMANNIVNVLNLSESTAYNIFFAKDSHKCDCQGGPHD